VGREGPLWEGWAFFTVGTFTGVRCFRCWEIFLYPGRLKLAIDGSDDVRPGGIVSIHPEIVAVG
jgi:hypothetical protein